jgi:hypothetical protein
MRRANRRDSNHREVINEFEKLGWEVLDIADLKNCCDIVAAVNNITICVEIKDGSKPPSQRKLTSGEDAFMKRWKGLWFKVETLDDVRFINNRFNSN